MFKEEPKKYNENLEVAKLLADKYDMKIKIRPIVNVDKYKNPDYIINDMFADQSIYNPRKSKSFINYISNSFSKKFGGKYPQINKGYLIIKCDKFNLNNEHIKYIEHKMNEYKERCKGDYLISNEDIKYI